MRETQGHLPLFWVGGHGPPVDSSPRSRAGGGPLTTPLDRPTRRRTYQEERAKDLHWNLVPGKK